MGAAYAGLFLAAFGAATLLPLQSEALLVGLIVSEHYWLWGLLGVATLGNVLGSLVNWWLGRGLERFQDRRWFPLSPQHMAKAQKHYQRFGHWSLLFSWLPVVGDPLTLIAGVMHEPLGRFLLIVTLAKGARYGVLAMLTLGWLG
ncbi:DedA family protein [Pseudomonas granadensis]|uniref:DedA family protein n=1 Tax=Pseudomonas granadensis TaxID=1421430 RepID=A0ABX7GRE4_9PSED|nr:YqaA family protein [Pseudomonas granadensis]MBN6776509.1 DedA family protein [Pseudomonas granadensis]MBN6807756.1 DedA family protein [Pseudomonas granadensis]MBN6834539.1 DedA family protein [Pseudomonas granadensis]MBN6842052.1 DedA family protein [Pseudomonas granadensis]MBN6870648.1 DedA family protein [Pseudomonas granadensis]